MELFVRPKVYTLPSYSLTSDLLGFLRCGLQYRYTRLGQLPASRPVQMWFGQFIHSVLEEAYRRYDRDRKNGEEVTFPWSQEIIEEICELIKRRLAAQRLFPWDKDLEELGDARAASAINDLGPELFPLIHRAEVRLTGARILPLERIPAQYRFREADRYEMVGVIDVITHLQVEDPAFAKNRIIRLIRSYLPDELPPEFELIIDYKGMRRPPMELSGNNLPSLWDIYGWQVQTYAHLRSTHLDSLPIAAGIIIYLNELYPTKSDMSLLKKEVRNNLTDAKPIIGSHEEKQILSWRDGAATPLLPLDYRLMRAIRVVSISESTVMESLERFDEVVTRIEICRGRELKDGRIINSWEKNSSDDDTCVRCDSRTFCPAYTEENSPRLPGMRRH